MTNPYVDKPRSLKEVFIREARINSLSEPHIVELTNFVDRLREDTELGENIPYFDPSDGGKNAEILFLLEAPGPKAVQSGFVSRNNNDKTAENFFRLNAAAGIDRKRTIMWNIVPWHVNPKIGPTPSELDFGLIYFLKLLDLLPKHQLRFVICVGKKAYIAAIQTLTEKRPEISIIESEHPSATNVNCNSSKQFDRTKNNEVINMASSRLNDRAQINDFLNIYNDTENKASHKGMRCQLIHWLNIGVAINELN